MRYTEARIASTSAGLGGYYGLLSNAIYSLAYVCFIYRLDGLLLLLCVRDALICAIDLGDFSRLSTYRVVGCRALLSYIRGFSIMGYFRLLYRLYFFYRFLGDYRGYIVRFLHYVVMYWSFYRQGTMILRALYSILSNRRYYRICAFYLLGFLVEDGLVRVIPNGRH